MGDSLAEIEQALEAADGLLPTILGVIGAFYPPAAAFAKFLPLVQVAISGVKTVAQATGHPLPDAQQTVIDHLTPGAANAPALSPAASPFQESGGA